MPIRWYGPADPDDPTYRHFERIVNLTLHGALFAATNSGLWVVEGLRHPWPRLGTVTLGWAALLAVHLLVVIQRRPRSSGGDPSDNPAGSGSNSSANSAAGMPPLGTLPGHPEPSPDRQEQP